MFKKFISVISASILCLVVFSSIIVASPKADETQTIFEKPEITDLNKLYDNAKNGITDDSRHQVKAVLKNMNSNQKEEEQITTYSTTQLLKKQKLANGQEVNSYVTTNFAKLSNQQIDKIKQESNYRTQGNMEDDKWDSSGGVQAYSTIYWTTYSSTRYPLVGAIEMNKVTGGVSNHDSRLTVNYGKVTMQQNGMSDVTGFGITGQVKPWTNSSLAYTYNRPTSWVRVQNYSSSTVGSTAEYIVTSTTQGNSWALHFPNLKFTGV